MEFKISFQTAVLGFFFLQGLLFAGLLWRAGRVQQHRPSHWLAGIVVLCCLYIFPFLAGYQGWYGKDGYREVLLFVPFQQFFLIGPLIYFYVCSQLNQNWRLHPRDWWHFLPGAVYLLYIFIAFVTDVLVLGEYYFYANGRDKDLAGWYQITGLACLIVYTGVAYRKYGIYQQNIYRELSFAEAVVYRWVGRFLVALLIIMVLRILALVFLPDWGNFGRWFPYYAAFGAITCYIALAGHTNMVRSLAAAPFVAGEKELEPEPAGETAPDPDLDHWLPQVTALMETDKLYENPSLTLSDVARAMGLNRRQVSQLINQGFGQNFNDFVNQYRVKAVKEQFAANKHEEFTILSIALACGFNSKTTFNRVFKKYTARTPVQYLAERSKV